MSNEEMARARLCDGADGGGGRTGPALDSSRSLSWPYEYFSLAEPSFEPIRSLILAVQ
jgi:hypothetical protein